MQSEVVGTGRTFGEQHAPTEGLPDRAAASAGWPAGTGRHRLPLVMPRPTPRRAMVGWLAAAGDAWVLTAAALVCVFALQAPAWPFFAAGLMLMIAALAMGQYRKRDETVTPAGLVLPWLGAAAATLVLVLLTSGQDGALGPLAVWAVATVIGLTAWRLWLGRRVAAGLGAAPKLRIALVGSATAGPLLAAIGTGARVELTAHYSGDTPPDAELIQLLQRAAADGRIDAVVLALPWTVPANVARSCDALRHLTADVWLLADPNSPATLAMPAGPVPEVAMLAVAQRRLVGWRGTAKRIEDLVLASLALLLLSPLMLLAAALIAMDSPGAVLLRQRRFGYGNVPFLIYKFRTMYEDRGDQTGAHATVPGDRRVTRVGRFLRASSVDELPQLFNVLQGDMSLVGPRPHPVEMRVLGEYYHDAVPGYRERHRVKPGITGLAQINGYRGLVDTREKAEGRLAWDLAYVERWSPGMDMRIIARTLFKGFFGPGAF